jgi:hypothetical protein
LGSTEQPDHSATSGWITNRQARIALTEALFVVVMALSWGVMAGPARAATATQISVALSAPTVTADGSSSVTATVTVLDATNAGVPGDNVTVASTDPQETIVNPASDVGGGTYTTTITSSKTAGTATTPPRIPPPRSRVPAKP